MTTQVIDVTLAELVGDKPVDYEKVAGLVSAFELRRRNAVDAGQRLRLIVPAVQGPRRRPIRELHDIPYSSRFAELADEVVVRDKGKVDVVLKSRLAFTA